jgi:signal transduction histidine kinase
VKTNIRHSLVFLCCLLSSLGPLSAQEIPGSLSSSRIEAKKLYDTLDIRQQINNGIDIAKRSPNNDTALLFFKQAFARSAEIGFAAGASDASYHMGCVYKDRGEYAIGVIAFKEGLPYADASGNRQIKGQLLNGVGSCYFSQTDYKQAAAWFYKAQEEIRLKKLTDPYYVVSVFNNMGFLWMQLKDSVQALRYVQKAKQAALDSRDDKLLGNVYVNLGYYNYVFRADLKAAEECYKQSLRLAQAANDLRGQQTSIHNLGSLMVEQGQPEKAIAYFRQALELKTDSDPYTSVIGGYYALATVYFSLKDYEKAESNVMTALNKARETGMKEYVAKGYELLYLIYSSRKQYEKAFGFARMYILVNDSIITAEKNKAINELEIRYSTLEKDRLLMQKQLQIGKQENNLRKKNILIAWISGGALLITLILFSLYRLNKHRQNLQLNQIRILKQEQEIGRLKAMMQGEEKERTRIARELHDGIGGMLVAVKMNLGVVRKEYPQLKDPRKLDDILEMLNDTSSEVRKTAHNLMPDILTRHNLSEALVIYTENINTSDELEIELQFHGKIDQLNKGSELIIYRIIQELIQNIIKHANATYAVVQLVANENKLSIFVEDNGTGFDMDEVDQGYGLKNLKTRVLTLQGDLSITSEKGRNTTIYIEFDLEKLKTHTES